MHLRKKTSFFDQNNPEKLIVLSFLIYYKLLIIKISILLEYTTITVIETTKQKQI